MTRKSATDVQQVHIVSARLADVEQTATMTDGFFVSGRISTTASDVKTESKKENTLKNETDRLPMGSKFIVALYTVLKIASTLEITEC